MRLATVLCFGLVGVPASAAADNCPQPSSEIATDRPDVTNSSLVVPQGSFQQENGFNISRRDGGAVWDGTNTRLRLGIVSCLEVLVDIPTYFDAISGHAAVQFPWSLELIDGWGLSGMFTNFIAPADPINKLSTETTFVIEREFGKNAFLFVEYVGDYHTHGGPSYLINSGGGYRITRTQQIDFQVAMGLNDNAPSYIFGVGYSFRFDGLF